MTGYEELIGRIKPGPGFSKEVNKQFDRIVQNIVGENESEISDANLILLTEAAYLANMYGDAERVSQHALYFEMAARRGLLSDSDYQNFYSVLVKARQWSLANELRQSHPLESMELLPRINDVISDASPGPTLWQVDDHQYSLSRGLADMSKETYIIAIVHPLCHFSSNAMIQISSDPKLAKEFEGRTLWIAPPDGRLDVEKFQDWNNAHPKFAMQIAHAERDWPMIEDWATPNFYFFRTDEIVARVKGWPKLGRRDELLKAFKALDAVK